MWVFPHETMSNCYFLLSCDFVILFSAGLFDFELTHAILTHVKSYFWTVFRIKPFLPNRAQRPDKNSPTWNFMENLMVPKTWLGSIGFKSFYIKNLEKVEKNMNIQEYLKKFQHCSSFLDMCFHVNR